MSRPSARTAQPRSRRINAPEALETRTLLSANAPVLPGDYDGDLSVTQGDAAVWRSQYGAQGDALAADGNGDGRVDAADYTVWRNHLGQSRDNQAPTAADDTLQVNHGESAVVLATQLLGNDEDPECSELRITGVSDAVGGHAMLRDGYVLFVPHASHGHGGGAHPAWSFRYTIADAHGGVAEAQVTLNERPPAHGAGDEQRGAEHAALFALVDPGDATAIAATSGPWTSPDTWLGGRVPQAGDRVLIHNTVDVEYDAASDQALEWLRVDGTLTFRADASTRLVAETIVVDPSGVVTVGAADTPIAPDVVAEILIDTTGGALSEALDPTLVGRGFISHGVTSIHGAAKAEYTTLAGDATAGDSFIELADSAAPAGWRIGDVLLVAGTEMDRSLLGQFRSAEAIVDADADNARFKDELLEITAFETVGDRVRVRFRNVTNQAAIDTGATTLSWDHTRPDGETFDPDELAVHVANLTRNVVIRSSDPTVDTQQRGHFMVMHNVNAEIHNAQFKDLGRTDKRRVVDDPAAIGNFDGSPGTGTNPRGRYGLHLHRLGANSLDGPPAQITGNVVWGAPGWGIVHHDSHAVLENNVVFDVAGAGIVAEDGNELGEWRGNLVVKITGDLVNNFDDNVFFQTPRGRLFDLGFVGSGYWVQGGGFGVLLEDNIAASVNAAGFDLVHNTDGLANVEQIPVDLIHDPAVREAIRDAGFETVTPNNIPSRGVEGLTVYNAFRGVHTWLHNRDSIDMEGTFVFPTFLAHEFRTTIRDYTIWGVETGVQNFYSTRIDFLDGLVVGDLDSPVPFRPSNQANNSTGVGLTHNQREANKLRFDGLRVEGFTYGSILSDPFNSTLQETTPYGVTSMANAQFANVTRAFVPLVSDPFLRADFGELYVLDESTTFSPIGPNVAPNASFIATSGAGLSVVLDASSSSDSDPGPLVPAGGAGIAVYAWDLDGDGQYNDAYGRRVTVSFDDTTPRPIGLRVWDDQGVTDTATQSVAAAANAYPNPFVDADFSDSAPFGGDSYQFWSGRRGQGWIAREVDRNPAGFAEIGTPQFTLGELGQIVRDEGVRRGVQTFSFDVRTLGQGDRPNDLRIRLIGVDGQWELDDLGGDIGAIFAMPEPRVATLVDTQLGPQQIADWQTQTFQVDLGATGYEYLVVYVDYFGYEPGQGDYFALDNFSLTAPAPGAAALSVAGHDAIGPRERYRGAAPLRMRWLDARDEALLLVEPDRFEESSDEGLAETIAASDAETRPVERAFALRSAFSVL